MWNQHISSARPAKFAEGTNSCLLGRMKRIRMRKKERRREGKEATGLKHFGVNS